jgi:hypothetical protein
MPAGRVESREGRNPTGAAGPGSAIALASDHRPGREGGPLNVAALGACDAWSAYRRKPQGRSQTPKRECPPDGAGEPSASRPECAEGEENLRRGDPASLWRESKSRHEPEAGPAPRPKRYSARRNTGTPPREKTRPSPRQADQNAPRKAGAAKPTGRNLAGATDPVCTGEAQKCVAEASPSGRSPAAVVVNLWRGNRSI